jgi:hypothetical protein
MSEGNNLQKLSFYRDHRLTLAIASLDLANEVMRYACKAQVSAFGG